MAKKNVKKVPKKKKVRRNIRKLITNLNIRTSEAVRLENERKKRIESLPKIPPNILDSNLVVDEKLFSFLKPYQQNGVKFMWNCCYESIEAMNNGQGGGCILAHCMGLGKLLDTFFLFNTLRLLREYANICVSQWLFLLFHLFCLHTHNTYSNAAPFYQYTCSRTMFAFNARTKFQFLCCSISIQFLISIKTHQNVCHV